MNTEDLHRNIVNFGEWILHSIYVMDNPNGNGYLWLNPLEQIWYTTEELFKIYLNQK